MSAQELLEDVVIWLLLEQLVDQHRHFLLQWRKELNILSKLQADIPERSIQKIDHVLGQIGIAITIDVVIANGLEPWSLDL